MVGVQTWYVRCPNLKCPMYQPEMSDVPTWKIPNLKNPQPEMSQSSNASIWAEKAQPKFSYSYSPSKMLTIDTQNSLKLMQLKTFYAFWRHVDAFWWHLMQFAAYMQCFTQCKAELTKCKVEIVKWKSIFSKFNVEFRKSKEELW